MDIEGIVILSSVAFGGGVALKVVWNAFVRRLVSSGKVQGAESPDEDGTGYLYLGGK